MLTSTSMRWLVVVAGAAMLLAVVAACAGETVEVPGETVVVKEEVIKEVQVPGETVVVEKEVIKEVMVPGETVTKEVIKEVEVPGETVVVEKEVVKTVEVPGETVVVEKVMVKEVQGKKYVTDPSTGKVVSAPEYGGTMTIGSILSIQIDSHTLKNVAPFVSGVLEKLEKVDWAIDRNEFDLTSYHPPIWPLRGNLAEGWEMPDDTTIIFNIREGVHWHDKAPMNGRELTAKDIEYNFHRWLAMGEFSGAERSAWIRILGIPEWESITATDDWTVVFKLKEPHIWALSHILSSEMAWIYPPEVIKEHGDAHDWKNLVGTGPFMLTDAVDGSSYTWTKNPDYWGYDEKYPQNRLPYIDQLRALDLPEETARIAALRTGKIDMLGAIASDSLRSIDTVERLRQTNPEIVHYQLFGRSNNVLNVTSATRPPFDDIRVRQAMQKAIDVKTIGITYYKGGAMVEPCGATRVPGYYTPYEEWPEELKQEYTYDPEGAEALLDAAGHERGADGIRFKVELPVHDFTDIGYVELVVEYFREIGIDLEFNLVPVGEYIAMIRATPTDLLLASGCSPALEDHHAAKYSDYSGDKWIVNWRKHDPGYERIIGDMRAATTLEEYGKFFTEADRYITEKHWNIWGPAVPETQVVQPWITGWNGEVRLGVSQSHPILARLWIDSELKAAMGH